MNTHSERNPRPSGAGFGERIKLKMFFLLGSENPRRSAAGFFKKSLYVILFILLFSGAKSVAAEPVNSLDELLEQVRREGALEMKGIADREARFLAEKDKQTHLLKEARAEQSAEEKRSRVLKSRYKRGEKELSGFEALLQKESGTLGELVGIVKQHAREAGGTFKTSLVSVQRPERRKFINHLEQSKGLPTITEMEKLWFLLQEEMTESGKVVRFSTLVVTPEGKGVLKPVTRIGVFNVVSEGKYFQYLPDTGKLVALSRQPGRRLQEMASGLEEATSGVVQMAVDPSRGAILSLLVQSPDTLERIRQGGAIGYFIIALGCIALLLVCERFAYLTIVGRRIFDQRKEGIPRVNNALGRIMQVYTEDLQQNVETLSHRLDEATLKEIPRLERGLTTIAIFAAVAPLLGLLGTVTGMIETFQSITLFGTGDPKLMSGGISQALITTELGLIVAIPIVLLHSLLSGKSNRLIQILDEQSSGMVARLSEKVHGNPS